VRALGTTTSAANPPRGRAAEPILQFDGQGQLAKRYLYGPAVDQVLAEESLHQDAGSGELLSDGVRWPLADHLGTVRDLAVLDDNGTPDDTSDDETQIPAGCHFRYDAFGNCLGDDTPAAVDLLALALSLVVV